MPHPLRPHWEHLRQLLEAHAPTLLSVIAQEVGWETDAELDALLISNELWGGAGSIADQAGIERDGGAKLLPGRVAIEQALITLGTEQLRTGKTNPRTAMWVNAFSSWRQSGI